MQSKRARSLGYNPFGSQSQPGRKADNELRVSGKVMLEI